MQNHIDRLLSFMFTKLCKKHKSNVVKDILNRIQKMNMDCIAEIYDEALTVIEDLRLEIANKARSQLELLLSNRSAAASFNLELHLEQNYNTADRLSYV